MIWPVDLLIDLQSSLEAFSGFLQITQVSQDPSEVVDIDGHVGMIWSVDLLIDLQSSLEAFSGFLQITQVLQDHPRLLTSMATLG